MPMAITMSTSSAPFAMASIVSKHLHSTREQKSKAKPVVVLPKGKPTTVHTFTDDPKERRYLDANLT